MKAALTVDDLPHWPEYPYPQGHSARSVADALIDGFRRHGLKGIYAFANSKPYIDDSTLTTIMDDWLAAGTTLGTILIVISSCIKRLWTSTLLTSTWPMNYSRLG